MTTINKIYFPFCILFFLLFSSHTNGQDEISKRAFLKSQPKISEEELFQHNSVDKIINKDTDKFYVVHEGVVYNLAKLVLKAVSEKRYSSHLSIFRGLALTQKLSKDTVYSHRKFKIKGKNPLEEFLADKENMVGYLEKSSLCSIQ